MTDESTRAEVVRYIPTQAVSLLDMPDTEFARMKGIASALAQSGVFKDARQAPVAFAKMVLGRELGLGIAQSMQGLHLVEGAVTMHYSTMLACVRARGWKYRIDPAQITGDGKDIEGECTITWTDPDGDEAGTSTFSAEDARRAGLIRDKGGWKTYPQNMLLARAVSNGVRAYCPEALGGMPVYVTGEIEPEEVVDGLPGGSGSAGADADIEAVLALVADAAVRDRIRRAYHRAQEVRPGQVSAAVVQMSVAGQRPEAVLAYAERLEAENARAEAARTEEEVEEISEAEVVPDLPDVEGLRRKLSDAMERRAEIQENPSDEAETERALAEVDDEIREYEDILRGAGATVPGQESLL